MHGKPVPRPAALGLVSTFPIFSATSSLACRYDSTTLGAVMTETNLPRVPKWPFIAGDMLLVMTAGMLVWTTARPLTLDVAALCVIAVVFAALIGLTPYVMEYHAQMKLAEARLLADGFRKLEQLESLVSMISAATAQWFGIHDLAKQALAAAKDVTEQMTAEATAFREFLQKANDSERAMLRLEVDKLARTQSEWLKIMVMMLDHVYALYRAAEQSGKPDLIEQISKFQEACRDLARRIGLVPLEATPGEPYDPARHAVPGEASGPSTNARVAETLATGYLFQNKQLRPIIVRIEEPDNERAPVADGLTPQDTSTSPVLQALNANNTGAEQAPDFIEPPLEERNE